MIKALQVVVYKIQRQISISLIISRITSANVHKLSVYLLISHCEIWNNNKQYFTVQVLALNLAQFLKI